MSPIPLHTPIQGFSAVWAPGTDMAKDIIQRYFPPEPPTKGMDVRHIKFVDQLILHKGNKTNAYLSSGYKVKSKAVAAVNASRLLKNANVQRLLQFRMEQVRRKADVEVNQVRVIEEVNSLAYSNITDVLTWDCEGNIKIRPSHELSAKVSRTIKKIKVTRTEVPQKDGEPVVKINFEIEQHDKKGPLEILSRASKLVDSNKPPAAISINLNFAPSKNNGSSRRSPIDA